MKSRIDLRGRLIVNFNLELSNVVPAVRALFFEPLEEGGKTGLSPGFREGGCRGVEGVDIPQTPHCIYFLQPKHHHKLYRN